MLRIERSIDVNAPAEAIYQQLMRFAEYPRFMENADEVRQIDATHVRWRGRRHGQPAEWETEITEQQPNRHIAWREAGVAQERAASHRLDLLQEGEGRTRVTLVSTCAEDSLAAGGLSEPALGEMLDATLSRFKKFMESQAQGQDGRHAVQPGQAGRHSEAVSGYAAGSEGWDGNEDPGVPVISSSQAVTGEEARRVAQAEVGAIGRTEAAADGRERVAGDAGDRAQASSSASSSSASSASSAQAGDRSQPWLPHILRAWEEPMIVIRKMGEEMDQLFDKFVGRPVAAARARAGGSTAGGGVAGDWVPPIEVAQRANQIMVSADLPGVRRDDVQIEIQGDRLVIEGDRRRDSPGEESGVQHSERSYGHFYRVISLPPGADADAASASMQDGILQVVVPFHSSPQRGKRVDIRSR